MVSASAALGATTLRFLHSCSVVPLLKYYVLSPTFCRLRGLSLADVLQSLVDVIDAHKEFAAWPSSPPPGPHSSAYFKNLDWLLGLLYRDPGKP